MKARFQKNGHKCQLPVTDECQQLPDGPSKFVRLLRSWTTVCPTLPRTTHYLLSQAAIKRERRRHLTEFRNIVHPFSVLRFVWESYMMIVFITSFITMPLQSLEVLLGKQVKDDSFLFMITVWCHLGCAADIMVSFFTGYFDSSSDNFEVVLDRRRVVLNYCKTFFLFDLLTTGPFLAYTINYSFVVTSYNNTAFIIVSLLSACKVVRIGTTLKYAKRVGDVWGVNENIMDLVTLGVGVTLFLHFATCMQMLTRFLRVDEKAYSHRATRWQEMENLHKEPLITFYIVAFFRAVSSVTGTGFNVYVPRTPWAKFYVSMLCITGKVLTCVLLGKLNEKVQGMRSSKAKYEQVVGQLDKFIKHRDLPPKISCQLRQYYNFHYNSTFYQEEQIMNTLSPILKMDLVVHNTRKLVENVSFFENMPANQVIKMISCIKRELCLSNDVIFRFNELGSCLYFIKSGAVALYTPKGKEVLHLEDGDFFGEAALLFDNRRRMGTMVAIETSELYVLNRKNFDLLILPHPELVKALEAAAIIRINHMFDVEERSDNDQSHLEERVGM